MPMAGLGSRFKHSHYNGPKPLIRVDEMPMFQKALSSLNPLQCKRRHTFIIRAVHQEQYGLEDKIREILPESNVVKIKNVTRGAVETCMLAQKFLSSNETIIVMDCDLWFKSRSYLHLVERVLNGTRMIHGGLLYFESNSPRYSYAEIIDGKVLRTAEKKVISGHALVGAYLFSSASIFIDVAKKLLNMPTSDAINEYYVSLLYNILIDDNCEIAAANIDEYYSFGTPEELMEYNKRTNNLNG